MSSAVCQQTEKVNKRDEAKEISNSIVVAAVRRAFPDIRGRLFCKFLWFSREIYKYRVNWYTETDEVRIAHSKFLKIREERDGLVIEEVVEKEPEIK